MSRASQDLCPPLPLEDVWGLTRHRQGLENVEIKIRLDFQIHYLRPQYTARLCESFEYFL